MTDPGFWRDKRVFLTGHTGFKGSWLSLWLTELGATVVGFSLPPPTDPSLYVEARVDRRVRSVMGDVRDAEQVHVAMAQARPDVVIHMAAQPLVRQSYRDPVETFATNVMGTVHVLDAVRRIGGVQAVVNVTTDKCYENREWSWGYRENEAMGGHDPYSSSKGCSELATAAFRRSFFEAGPGLASARAGNVIGGGDWAQDRLVPDILRAFEEGRPALIRNPNAIRPWQHVLEPLSGYLLLAERLFHDGVAFAEGWNFGPRDDDARPVRWIADQLVNSWGNDAAWRADAGLHPHEGQNLTLDIANARAKLGWTPKWALSTALDQIVDWHQAWLARCDMEAVCLRQIALYSDLLKKNRES